MTLLGNAYMNGAVWFAVGVILGYWLVRWKERNVRAALAIKEEALLEGARRQAENIAKEAQLKGNEAALKLREEAEQSFTSRRLAATEAEKRLVERESLINRQLESMVQEEKSLREQQLEGKLKQQQL